jgi:hypothetical protein
MDRRSILLATTTDGSSPNKIVAGDVVYHDGEGVKIISADMWADSLGTAFGIVVIPPNFLPDGKMRIIPLFGQVLGNYQWGNQTKDTELINYDRVPTISSNQSSNSSYSSGYLPSDIFSSVQSIVDPISFYSTSSSYLIPSPYARTRFNSLYSNPINNYYNALSDFNGLNNTTILKNVYSSPAAIAAFDYIDGLSTAQWYLPAIGELGFLMLRLSTINDVISRFGGTPVSTSSQLWSSTECSSGEAWILNTSDGKIATGFYNKNTLKSFIPFALVDVLTDIEINLSSALFYTSSNSKVVTPNNVNVSPANFISNNYIGGSGILQFDQGIPNISQNMFKDCTTLKTITIPTSVTRINNYAFQGCTSLSKVTLSEGLRYIDTQAFSGCKALTSITIPNGDVDISNKAFEKCGLKTLYLGSGKKSFSQYAFSGCYISKVYVDNLYDWCRCHFPSTAGSSSISTAEKEAHPLNKGADLYINNVLIKDFNIPEGITVITEHCFLNCKNITSVTIPDSVMDIRKWAFLGCSLTGVYCNAIIPPSIYGDVFNLPSSSSSNIYVYQECLDLYKSAWSRYASRIVPNGHIPSDTPTNYVYYTTSDGMPITQINPAKSNVYTGDRGVLEIYGTLIGKEAFKNCSNLTSVIINDGVTRLGESLFLDCPNLESVCVPETVTYCKNSFKNYSGKITVYSKIIENQGNTFNGDFTELIVGENITKLTNEAFVACESLTSVTIPDSVTEIGNRAFARCSSLTSVTIPDSVTTIGSDAFTGCGSPTSVYISDLAAWCNISFKLRANPLYNAGKLYLNNELVTDLVIPDSVTTIGAYAFHGCDSITNVTIEDGVTTIEGYAFEDCTSLTSVTIPDSVTKIRYWAFDGCSSLTSVYCKAATPPTGESYMFANNASGRKIYVPMESVEAYKSKLYWSDYAADIVGYDF